jgi:hypothetical protein
VFDCEVFIREEVSESGTIRPKEGFKSEGYNYGRLVITLPIVTAGIRLSRLRQMQHHRQWNLIPALSKTRDPPIVWPMSCFTVAPPLTLTQHPEI